MFLVEGETDAITLLQNGFAALGIPGAKMWKTAWAEHLQGCEEIYIWQEPDAAGAAFVERIARDLPAAKVIGPLAGIKDANELWLSLRQSKKKFVKEINRLANAAKKPAVPAPPGLIRLEDVEPRAPSWVWEGRLLRGGLTLLGGAPKVGKSFLTLKIAADITQPRRLPLDDGPDPKRPGDVFILSAEDNRSDTIRPRLDDLGADERHISLIDDDYIHSLDDLVRFVDYHIAEPGRNYKLLVIDTINSFLGNVDTHRDASVRIALKPLRAAVERWNIACLMITHPTKDTRGKELWQMMQGSIAFVGLPRVTLAAVDREDPLDGTSERALVQVYCTLTPPLPSVGYELDGEVEGIIRWTGESDITAKDFSTKSPMRGRLDEMDAWLEDLLADGPVPSSKVVALAAEQSWTETQIEGAKKRIGARSIKRALREGWEWCLPEHSDE